MKNIRIFLSENFHFLVVKFPAYLNKHVFVMSKGLYVKFVSDHRHLHIHKSAKIKFVFYNVKCFRVYIKNLSYIAYFRNLRKENGARISAQWVYWSVNFVYFGFHENLEFYYIWEYCFVFVFFIVRGGGGGGGGGGAWGGGRVLDICRFFFFFFLIFIPRHTIVAGYYGFTLDIRVSVHPSVSRQSVRSFFVSE